MRYLLQVLVAVIVVSSAVECHSIGERVSKKLVKEVTAIKQPVDVTLAAVGTAICGPVKRITGVEYDQVKGGREPDFNYLSLDFITESFRLSFNLSAAAELIPRTQGYDPHRKLVIFLHGYNDPTGINYKSVSEAFLKKGHYNILALDSSSLIRWIYTRSTTYVRLIGEKLGEVLAALVKSGMSPSAIHLVGHSLGAHISGFTGKTFTDLTGLRVARITGLDPAGPCFSNLPMELRLKETDADFVDVIHTDGGVYGIKEDIGHVDFFPNSGSEQPNCLFQTCSHSRVVLLFAESVENEDAFPAVRCNSWESFKKGRCDSETKLMGYGCTSDTRGSYFLRTGEDPPYGLGKDGTVYENNEGILKTIVNYGLSWLPF